MASSVDPTAEIAAVKARLDLLTGDCHMGVDQGTALTTDAWGNKAPYRDFEPGSVIPRTNDRILGAHTQAQPHIWAFQVHHVAPTRAKALELAIETDRSLMGWAPTQNASEIGTFFFTIYDEMAKNGESVQWIATRFYETTLGVSPDFTIAPYTPTPPTPTP